MDRKKTILIAVMINAGLLVVLFVAALAKEDSSLRSTEMAQSSNLRSELPLFSDTADQVVQSQPEAELVFVSPPPIQLPIVENSRGQPASTNQPENREVVVHRLPPLTGESNLTSSPNVSPSNANSDNSYYEVVVKKGDSLDKIAKAHHTTVDEIIKANQLPSSFLKVGQVLRLPKEKVIVRSTNNRPNPERAAPARTSPTEGPEYYTVKVGDNPWTIAMKHHMKVEELLRLNQLNEEKARKLKPGDRLRIR